MKIVNGSNQGLRPVFQAATPWSNLMPSSMPSSSMGVGQFQQVPQEQPPQFSESPQAMPSPQPPLCFAPESATREQSPAPQQLQQGSYQGQPQVFAYQQFQQQQQQQATQPFASPQMQPADTMEYQQQMQPGSSMAVGSQLQQEPATST